MGELHLDIIVDRMRREFSVNANVGKPQVAYREAIRKTVEMKVSLFVKLGPWSLWSCLLKLEPLKTGCGYEFVNEIVGGAVPKEYIPALAKAVKNK